MIPNLKILDEKNPILHKISKDVIFPLSDEDKKLINDSLEYLRLSQNESIAEEYHLRAGMGLAFVQLGKLKRIFVISLLNEKEDDTEEDSYTEYVIINPKIISESEELIYVGEGEGCLSVNREVEGIVPRKARITVEYKDMLGNIQTVRVREDIAIAFQHEIDHLNGILFTDKIDKNDPFKNHEKMREI